MKSRSVFWIFGVLQSLSMGFLIFVVFRSMNVLHGSAVVGGDTQVVLSVAFPLFLLLVEYVIYSRCQGKSNVP